MASSLRILSEHRINLDEVCRRLGTDDKPVHFTTAFRAMTRGIQLADGARVYLEKLKVGGRLITSIEAVERFVARVNGISLDEVEAESTLASGKQRAKELASVDAQLAAARI